MEKTEKKPGLLEKISFGMGDFSNNGIFAFVSTYLMFYYTDIACLDLGAISMILLIGRVVDAICSPIMGVIVDKTNTKYGKCRPFIAVGILPACALMVLLFSVPKNMGNMQKSLIAVGVYILFSVIFAFMNVPYSTMLNVLSADNEQRISFNLFKNVGANLGAIFVTAATLKFVGIFSGEGKNGFTGTAMLFALVFMAGSAMCVINTRERVTVGKGEASNWKESIKVVMGNRPWLILCCVQFLTLTSYITRNQGTIYYAKYYLGSESVSSWMLTLTSVIATLFSFVLPAIVKRHGTRYCVLVGNLIWSISMLGTWFVGKNIMLVLALHILTSIGWSMATGMIFVMLTQTIDYAQWKTGKRPQGLFTSLLAFVQKLGVASAGLICSQILSMGNYVANQEAGPSAIMAIRVLFGGLPLALSICCMVLISFYHLDTLYPKIERELKK